MPSKHSGVGSRVQIASNVITNAHTRTQILTLSLAPSGTRFRQQLYQLLIALAPNVPIGQIDGLFWADCDPSIPSSWNHCRTATKR
jgi:hypothetical protein